MIGFFTVAFTVEPKNSGKLGKNATLYENAICSNILKCNVMQKYVTR
jgi:hypothetical protein